MVWERAELVWFAMGVAVGFYSRGAAHRGEGAGVEQGHAIGGQCGGATDDSAVRASERENGRETSHLELLELAVCDVCGVLDGT